VYGDWLYTKTPQVTKLHRFELSSRHATVLEGSEGLWTPRWSPDGRYISALRQDSKALLVSKSGSSDWHEILRGDTINDPMWSADSRYIYCLSDRPNRLLRVAVSDGLIETIAKALQLRTTSTLWLIGKAACSDSAAFLTVSSA